MPPPNRGYIPDAPDTLTAFTSNQQVQWGNKFIGYYILIIGNNILITV